VRYIERGCAAAKPDPLGLPEIRLLLSEELAVVDNLSGKLHLIVYADPARRRATRRAWRGCRSCARSCASPRSCRARARAALEAPRSNIGERAFYDAVARCKRYITDGDMMQVQISQRSRSASRIRR
jgi:anthranilate synthase component 1